MSEPKQAKFTKGPYVKDYGGTIGHIKSVPTIPNDDGSTPTIARYDMTAMSITSEQAEANGHLFAASFSLYQVARAYEAFEAELLLSQRAWGDSLPRFTPKLLDRWMEIRKMRNAALKKAVGE